MANRAKNPPYVATRRAYLLTLYYAEEEVSFVTLQASHCSETRRFSGLADAFSYLLSVTQPGRREDKKPES